MHFPEHNNLIDRDQEGLRRFKGCTHAVIRLVHDRFDGFSAKEHTVAIHIDMENAYDSAWRDGLLVKLSSMCVSDRIWDWIYSFLHDSTPSYRIEQNLVC